MIELIKMTISEDAENAEQTVEISLGEYAELAWRDSLLGMIVDALYENASLSYRNDELTFSGASVDQLLRYGFPTTYQRRLKDLQRAKEKQDAEKERDEMITLVNLKDEEEDEKE